MVRKAKKVSGRIIKKVSGRIILTEGKIRKGGVKPRPSSPKPNIKPVGQKPSPQKSE